MSDTKDNKSNENRSKLVIDWSGDIERLEEIANKIRKEHNVFVTVIKNNGEIRSQW